MSIRRIAIAGPSLHPYYIRTVGALCQAFEELGVKAVPILQWLSGTQMETFVESFQPDVVMEINRSRNQFTGLPSKVRHVAWIQDSNMDRPPEGRHIITNDQFGGSDIHYTFVFPESIGLDRARVPNVRYLAPGVDISVFNPDTPAVGPINDVCFAGYMPTKETMDSQFRGHLTLELPDDRRIEIPNPSLFMHFSDSGLASNNFRRDTALSLAADYISTNFGITRESLEQSRHRDALILAVHSFESEWARWMERNWFIPDLLAATKDLVIYGPVEGWQENRKFARYYHGFLNTPRQMAGAYNAARIIAHIGALQMHSRVLEAMACARPVLVNCSEPGFGDGFGAIREHFEDSVHFVEYDRESLPGKVKTLLGDEAWRTALGEQAREAILAKHLWRHRAEQIISDLQE
jgi:glycosyltransferase involved in cell wall biosynthesis